LKLEVLREVVGGGHSGGQAGKVIYCYYCKETGHTKYNCLLLQEKQQPQFRSTHIAKTEEDQFDSRSYIADGVQG